MIIYVDDFKLAGPTKHLDKGWQLIQEPSANCPKGIEIDPPTAVGRYLGCEHHVTDQIIEWQGELPTVLDPPPKVKKAKSSNDDEESADGSAETGGGLTGSADRAISA